MHFFLEGADLLDDVFAYFDVIGVESADVDYLVEDAPADPLLLLSFEDLF